MSRLTKDIRERMARKLVAFRFTDEAKELLYADRTLFERAYAHRYTNDTLQHMEAVRKAFPSAFDEVNSMTVNAGGYTVRLGEGFRPRWVSVESDPNRSKKLVVEGYMTHNITDEKLIEDTKSFADKKRAFNTKCETAYYEAMAVLDTCSTGKKLAEAWPEAMEVIGDLIPEGSRTLPVVQVADVNKKFGLPPKKIKTRA
jgi:hypothetical protein